MEILIYDNRGNPISQGNGFIVRKDGVIVTNYHVITDAEDIKVKASGKVLKVEGLLYINKENDIVILKVESEALPIVKLGDIDKAVVGENVYVISKPGESEKTLSEGILQGVKKIDPKIKLLQITAPTSAGSSGAPVFNKNGEVIGVATLSSKRIRNLTYAVPINLIKDKISAKTITALKDAGIEDHHYWFIPDGNCGYDGSYTDAIEAYKQEIKIDPDDMFAHFNLGCAYCKAGMYKEAVEAYKQAIRIEPDFAEAYYSLGLTYGRDLGMLEEAIEAFKQVIRIKPDFPKACFRLGVVYEKLGMYKRAIEVYKKAGELEPMNEDIHAELADILLESGDHEQSIREYEKTFKLVKENMKSNPKDASTYGDASWYALFLGDFLVAQKYAKLGISYDPKEYWISCNLGHAYLLQGQKAKAIIEYKYFIHHSTENPKDDIKEDFSLLKKRFEDKISIIEMVENELAIK